MKTRIKKILIGIICLASVSAFMTLPAQAQNEERVLSSAQQWVTGIEVPGLGYRSWVTGIQPPSTVEVAEEATGIDALVDKIMSPVNAVIYNAVFFSVPFLGSDLKLVVARWAGSGILDDYGWSSWNVQQILRMHSRSQIPK